MCPPRPERAGDSFFLGRRFPLTLPEFLTVTIDPAGVITLPMIGPVRAAGKTPEQLASDLTVMYSRVLQAPSVTVLVRHRLHR